MSLLHSPTSWYSRPDPSSPSETPGPEQQQEPRSFWSYALSQRFAWHLVWLSLIQLWHYLFIGTLNSLLTNLAGGDRALGMWWGGLPLHPSWALGTMRPGF